MQLYTMRHSQASQLRKKMSEHGTMDMNKSMPAVEKSCVMLTHLGTTNIPNSSPKMKQNNVCYFPRVIKYCNLYVEDLHILCIYNEFTIPALLKYNGNVRICWGGPERTLFPFWEF